MKTRMVKHALVCLCGTAIWIGASGCTFHRGVINPHVRDLDVSTLKVGETTWVDAIRKLGFPVSANAPEEMLRAELDERSLKYVAAEYRTFEIGVPYLVQFGFRWTDVQNTYEVLLEFDENDRLVDIYETKRETIWKPWEDEGDRTPPVTTALVH